MANRNQKKTENADAQRDDTFRVKSAEGHGFRTAAQRESAKSLSERNFARISGVRVRNSAQ